MIKEKMCFEVVAENDKKVYHVNGNNKTIMFRQVNLSDEAMCVLEDEIQKWEILDVFEWRKENLVYDDISSNSGEKIIPLSDIEGIWAPSHISGNLRGGYLVKDGQFIGVVLDIENTSSYGMSCDSNHQYGILLTDGQAFGRTSYSHCSTEVDDHSKSDYYLRKK